MTATEGTLMTRPCSPRFSSRIPPRISFPISLFDLGIDFVFDFLKHVAWNVVRYILRIERQHPNHSLTNAHVIHGSQTSPLGTSRYIAADLSHATGPGYQIARFWISRTSRRKGIEPRVSKTIWFQ